MKGFIFLLLLLIVVVQLSEQQPRRRRWRPIRLRRRTRPLTAFDRAPSEPERYHVAVPAYAPFRPAEDREDKLDRRRRRRRRRRGGRDPVAPVSAMPPALLCSPGSGNDY